MHALLNKYKWLKYVIGGFIVSLGILIIILTCTKMGQLQNVINIVIGCSKKERIVHMTASCSSCELVVECLKSGGLG